MPDPAVVLLGARCRRCRRRAPAAAFATVTHGPWAFCGADCYILHHNDHPHGFLAWAARPWVFGVPN